MLAPLLLATLSVAAQQRLPRVGPDHALPVSIEFGADGTSIFSIRPDGIVQRWSLTTGCVLASFGSPALKFRTAAAAPDDRSVATGAEDGVLRIWRESEVTPWRTLQAHRSPIVRIVWSPDGQRVLTLAHQRDAALWDATSGESIARFFALGEDGEAACAAFSADSLRLALSIGETFVRAVDARTGELLHTFGGNSGGVSRLEFAPRGHLLLSETFGHFAGTGRCRLFDIDRAEVLTTIGRSSNIDASRYAAVVMARFSDGGSSLTTLDEDGLLEVRSTTTLEVRSSLDGPMQEGWPPAGVGDYDPKTDLLLAAPEHDTVHAFHASDGTHVGDLECDPRARIRIHPLGRLVVTVLGHVLRIFDARTLELRLTRVEYEDAHWLCITPDLEFMGTPCAEGWARVDGVGTDGRADGYLDAGRRDPEAVRAALAVGLD